MSINHVSSAGTTQPVAPQTGTKATPVRPGSEPSKDSVTISNAGKVALEEARETAAQTASEARSGDHQAQRAMAKAAASVVSKK